MSLIQRGVFAFTFFIASFTPLISQLHNTRSSPPLAISTTTRAQERWADKTLRHLTLEEKIGQMIEVRGIMGYYNADDSAFKQLINDIHKYHLGAVHLSVNTDGPLLLRTGPYEAAMTTNLLQRESHSKVPLIFSVDFERGPSMRLTSIEAFPQPMAFGATHNPVYVE
jgi:beta-N-acetylhexosaminidase